MQLDSDVRRQLLDGVAFFLRHAIRIAGIERIGLIGSLATSKECPKDADLLIQVADEMDLTPLAALGRRLKGRMQSQGLGADIFLANPANEYLGRICQWKTCRPGIRRACDAAHCGQREFLHDDFGDVQLASGLIAAPPAQLWPLTEVRGSVPPDVVALVDSWRAAI